MRSGTASPGVWKTVWVLLGLVPGPCLATDLPREGISVQRALIHIRTLAGEIGPRKTGTEANERAIRYLSSVLEGYGLQVETDPVESVATRPGAYVVARTRNVVGRLEGSRPETILIGAHHDSRNRKVPGALDDASGVAVVLELARVLSEHPPPFTVLFVLFGAEEEGCIGSRHFVEHRDLSDLRLVITLDPVGKGKVFLAPFPGPPSLRWNRAIYEIKRRRGIDQVLVDPLYAIAPRFLRVPHLADHAPFLERGIPGLNLSSQFDLWEYHTEMDRIERVEPETLSAAGQIVLGLVRGFRPQTLEGPRDPHYLLLRLPGLRIFLPGRVLYAVSLGSTLLSLLLVFPAARSLRVGEFAVQVVRCIVVVGFLLALAMSGSFLSEWFSEVWTGFRYPWFARQGLSLWMALSLGGATTWLAIRISPRILPMVQSAPYLLAACMILFLELGTFAAFRLPEFAFLFAPPLVAIASSFRIVGSRLRFFLLLAGMVHLPGLLLPGSYRAALRFTGMEVPAWLAMAVLLAFFLPFTLALVGLAHQREHSGGRLWRSLVHPYAFLACLVAFAVLFVTWVRAASYDPSNRRTVLVREVVDLERGQTHLELRSQENLRDIRILRPFHETVDLPVRSWRREVEHLPDLMQFTAGEDPDPIHEQREVRVSLELTHPANRIRIRFRSAGGFLLPEENPARPGNPAGTKVPEMEWRFVHELSTLEERFLLRPVQPSADLTVEVEAEFEEDLMGLRLVAPHTVFYHRNRVRAVVTLSGETPRP